nr:hypothetical protein B0A51_01130 [Rachicladosporium sp. CCFEE 5018]
MVSYHAGQTQELHARQDALDTRSAWPIKPKRSTPLAAVYHTKDDVPRLVLPGSSSPEVDRRQRRQRRSGRFFAPQPASIARGPSRWTIFGARGCNIYGYPSFGGILIKEADVLDLLHLSLSHSQACERSSDPTEEDELCDAFRRIGAKWWISKRDWANATMKARESTEEEEKVVVYGWPTEGAGVWVLRYEGEDSVPDDFGRLRLALSMEERIAMMREYGAEFTEDASRVPELRGCYVNQSDRHAAES